MAIEAQRAVGGKTSFLWQAGTRQLLMAHLKMGHGVLPCLAPSAPTRHPLNDHVLSVRKLTLRMVHLHLAIAERPGEVRILQPISVPRLRISGGLTLAESQR
jgi:hypothetical protein